MNKIKYIVLLLIFTISFVNAERNPLLDFSKDPSKGGIIDIGVNNLKADQLITYVKELSATAPDTRLTQKKIILQERNVTREDCILDQIGNYGCTIASVDCTNTGEKLSTPAVDHVSTISGVAKIAEERTRIVPYNVSSKYNLNNTKATEPAAWSGILSTYPIYSSNGYLYKYTFFAAKSGYYYVNFKANGKGTVYIDGVSQGSVSSSAGQVSAKVWLSGPKDHVISLKATAPSGDPYHGLAATITYNGYQIWNTLKGQIGGLSYTTYTTVDYRSSTSCSYSTLCLNNGNDVITAPSSERVLNFYAKTSGTYKLYGYLGSGSGALKIDGATKITAPSVNKTVSVYISAGWHKISYYAAYGNTYISGCSSSQRQYALIYLYNPSGYRIWQTNKCQVGDNYFTVAHNNVKTNTYKLNNKKASVPIAWTGVLKDYPITFTNGVFKQYNFYAFEDGVYDIRLKAYTSGNIYIDNVYKGNVSDYRYGKTIKVTLTQGEHTISFKGNHGNSPYSGWGTTITHNGTQIWNTLKGQVGGKVGQVEEKYLAYVCPEGFTDTSNDIYNPGNTCKKTYTWRTYSCPSDVNVNGTPWTGPVVNSGGDCGGYGVSDGGICPGQPSNIADNCTRAFFTCPTDPNIVCIAKPNETETQNISNGYKYIPGYSNQHFEEIHEPKLCPPSDFPKFFCPTGWTPTDNTRECIKQLSPNDVSPGNSQADCKSGFKYSSTVGSCVKTNNMSQALVIDADNNIFYLRDQNEGYDDQLDICLSMEVPNCAQAGFSYDPEIGLCVKSLFCAGTIVNGECLEKPLVECPAGMSYDLVQQKCQSPAQCAIGQFNQATQNCQDSTMSCPIGFKYNKALSKCEKDMDTKAPICPQAGMTYDPITEVCTKMANYITDGWSIQENYYDPAGNHPNGVWNVLDGGTRLQQTVNRGTTLYVSNNIFPNHVILEGKVAQINYKHHNSMGLAFGWTSNSSFYVVDWGDDWCSHYNNCGLKTDTTDSSTGAIQNYRDLQIIKINSSVEDYVTYLRENSQIVTSIFGPKWESEKWYTIKLQITGGNAKVWIDDILHINKTLPNGAEFPAGRAGFYNLSTPYIEYKDFKITSKAICESGYTLNEAYKICYKDLGTGYEYNFETEKIYQEPGCPAGGLYDSNTQMCAYNSGCPASSYKSADGLYCLSSPTWSCQDTTWTYQATPSPFKDYTGSCIVPSSCPENSTSLVTNDGTKICTSTQTTSTCADGYSSGTVNGQLTCLAEAYCEKSWLEEDLYCTMKYYWEEYMCPNGWQGPTYESTGDCKGNCGYNGCDCDAPIPPANNCRQQTTTNTNGEKIEKRRKLEFHNVLSGNTLSKPDFGTMRSQICSEFPEDCENYIDEIEGIGNKLCFRKTKLELEECYEVEGCQFNGKIVGLKSLGDTITIEAKDGSYFDYADPQDPNHTSWDSYGFSISRHALLLSDGNWYIAETSLSPLKNASRGCGDEFINGLGGAAGFKTIPNVNYKVIKAMPANKCLFSNIEEASDCAAKIEITLPDKLTLVSISDLESVVSNVFGTAACNSDNKYDEHFEVNYDALLNRKGTGVLAGTSFTNANGSAVIGEGYGHDVVHTLTLVNKNTLFGGYEKLLGFRGSPSCGVYQYDPKTNLCITPINYTKWIEKGDDSEWSQVVDLDKNVAMYQKINTAKNAFFLSDYLFDSYDINGNIGVGMRNDCGDDDTIGLVFGYIDEKNYYALFWGGDMRNIYGNTCPWYNNLNIIGSTGKTYREYCCNNVNSIESATCGGTYLAGGIQRNGIRLAKFVNGTMTTLGTLPNSNGWKCGEYSHFKILSNSDGIQVWKDTNKIFDLPGERAPEGKAGYFGLSQPNAYYKNFTVSKAPSCPIGTKLDFVSDQCKEIECPRHLTLNKKTGMCQQVVKSTCSMNGNVGWIKRKGGIVSVGSEEEQKSYVILKINDEALADFKDGTKWKGFNQATMAIRLSDGYWYVSSLLKDINGINLAANRKLISKIRYISPSNFVDLEDLKTLGTKKPILCQFEGKALNQSICSREVEITFPGFGKTIEAIADIQSLFKIFNPNDSYSGVDDNEFTDYKITINNLKTLDYSGIGQMVPVNFDKSDTLFKDSTAFDINDRLRFWDSYEDGYLGFIEFMRGVKKEDQIDGFMPENPTPFDLNALGFTSIGTLDSTDGYLTDSTNKTYFIRPVNNELNPNECMEMASRYNLTIHNGVDNFGAKEQNDIAKVLGAYNPNACVLETNGYETPDSVLWALKTEYSTAGFNFVCSPYECQEGGYCEMAACEPDYQGGLYPSNYEREYPLGSISPDACEDDICDTIRPYEPVCGQENGCDTNQIDVIEMPDGTCKEMYCPPGTGYLNTDTGFCEIMKCPPGTQETINGDCIKS